MLPGNEAIWNILKYLRTQWRAGFGGAYGLDYNVADIRAVEAGIVLDQLYYAKVAAYEQTALAIIRKPGKPPCTPEKERMCRDEYGETFEWTCTNCKEIRHGRRTGK